MQSSWAPRKRKLSSLISSKSLMQRESSTAQRKGLRFPFITWNLTFYPKFHLHVYGAICFKFFFVFNLIKKRYFKLPPQRHSQWHSAGHVNSFIYGLGSFQDAVLLKMMKTKLWTAPMPSHAQSEFNNPHSNRTMVEFGDKNHAFGTFGVEDKNILLTLFSNIQCFLSSGFQPSWCYNPLIQHFML